VRHDSTVAEKEDSVNPPGIAVYCVVPPTGVGVHLPATQGQVIGCWQGRRQEIIGGCGAVRGWQAPQQSPTPSA
jgi:hypothetical protein